ncbi:glycosyltransferase [Actinomycetota bacterium]|nr:glycosyltransferase [Actinomycetota bacterium]
MNPLLKAKRRAGKVKRWVKRKFYERNIGKQYKAWLEEAHTTIPGSVTFSTTISIVIPVYNPPIQFLKECIDSVTHQTATNWQLIVSNDGSTQLNVNDYLTELSAKNNPKITILNNENGGISAAINAGLERATGEYFGMLDHDDALDVRCIEEFSKAVEQNNHPEVIYSDEDKISPSNQHSELYCKPDFSPELLLTQMYLCHFTIWKTQMVREVNGLRGEMDGAQDFDLALRLLPQLSASQAQVIHLPIPLYHWRAWSESTALTIEAKPWAQQAAALAQQDYLNTALGGGTVEPSQVQGLNEIHPVAPKTKVSVIIPTALTLNKKTKKPFVFAAIETLKQQECDTNFEIIVVTTNEQDPIPGADKQVTCATSNFNFSQAINLGAENADHQSEYLLLLNDDTEAIKANPITRMLEIAQIENVAAVGAKLSYPDGKLQHIGVVLLPGGPTHPFIAKSKGEYGYFGSALTPRNYSAVTAAAMLTSRKAFAEVHGFDTDFARDFNDVDYCLKLRTKNYRIAWTPYAHFTHHEGVSIHRKAANPQEAQLFNDRWQNKDISDPYYSPALNPKLERIYEAL